MLMRILADNPGKSFTKNIDQKFVNTTKELLREGRDMSVQQILRETLDTFETEKASDETLTGLRDMWRKEKAKVDKRVSIAVRSRPLMEMYGSSFEAATNSQEYGRPSVEPTTAKLLCSQS